MEITTLTDCTCGFHHDSPVTDQEILDGLYESWDGGDIQLWSSLTEVQKVSDWHAAHVEPRHLPIFVESVIIDGCLHGERHHKSVCTTDCAEAS